MRLGLLHALNGPSKFCAQLSEFWPPRLTPLTSQIVAVQTMQRCPFLAAADTNYLRPI